MDPNRRPEPGDTPDAPETPDDPNAPTERPPFDRDPEAQRAPGDGEEDRGSPPMQAEPPDVIYLDGPGVEREPVGNDNIREGRVGGVMGPPHASNGQGQGG